MKLSLVDFFFHSIFIPLSLGSRGIMSWWRHQMETFLRYWPFVRGIHRLALSSLHKDQWRGALMFSVIYIWTNKHGWVNNRDAGDLRHHRTHYDITVMFSGCLSICPKPEIPSFHPYMGPLVHPTNPDCLSGHLSFCPSIKFSGLFVENAWRKWSKICMLLYPDHLQNW